MFVSFLKPLPWWFYAAKFKIFPRVGSFTSFQTGTRKEHLKKTYYTDHNFMQYVFI